MRTIRIRSPKIDVTVPMGDGDARITGGIGGYQTVDVPDRIGATDWPGQGPIAQDVPVMLDGWRERQSVERQLRTLQKLGLPDANDRPPPVFTVSGPIHYPDKHWVLPEGGVELLDGAIRRRGDAELVRQPLMLHLLEFVRPDQVRRRPKNKIGVGPAVAIEGLGQNVVASRRYIVKAGDTLAKIAAYLYGDWKRWREIGERNGIRDPNKLLQTGRVLKL